MVICVTLFDETTHNFTNFDDVFNSDITDKIIMLSCSFNHYDELPKEIECLINLEILTCSYNHFRSLPKEIGKLSKLRELYCDYNSLTSLPKEIGNLTNIIYLGCSFNNFSDYLPEELGRLTNLEWFDCEYSRLINLPESLYDLVKLKKLKCSGNRFEYLSNKISNLINLEKFNCSGNRLTSLPLELFSLTNLKNINCSRNGITIIPQEIGRLVNLEKFSCGYNRLTSLPLELIQCRLLTQTYTSNNEFINLHPLLVGFIGRQYNHNNHNVYKDGQNIHNSNIQNSLKQSIFNILNDTISLTNEELVKQITESSINCKSHLLEYMTDETRHSIINITFTDLLLYVWNRIINHSEKEELFKRLDQEMKESECKCFTGRITRLVNTLSGGYFSDVIIGISDTEQISNVIIALQKQYTDEIVLKEQATKALIELGYSLEQIQPWIDNI